MKSRISVLLLTALIVVSVNCDKNFDKNRIQKRSFYHHPGAAVVNDLHYHTPGVLPVAPPNPLLFKPPVFAAPAAPLPATKFVPGDAWVTSHSVTFPRVPVFQPPVVPTAPLAPAAPVFPAHVPVAPPVFHAFKPAVAVAPPPPVNFFPVNHVKPVIAIPQRPVFAQPAFVPTAVAVKPIVPVLPPAHHHHHHHHVAVQPTVSSENPEIPENPESNNSANEIDEAPSQTEQQEIPQQSTSHNTIPLYPMAGLPPTFVMQIGSSGSGIDASAFARPAAAPSSSSSSSNPTYVASRPSSASFAGMVPQMMPGFFVQMNHQHPQNFPEPEQETFNYHPNTPASHYGPPEHSYGAPPSSSQRYRNRPAAPKRLRRPNMYRRKPHRHAKKLRYTIIKHHHDRK